MTDPAIALSLPHRVRFTRDVLEPSNTVLADLFPPGGEASSRLLAIVDAGLARAWPGFVERLEAYLRAHAPRAPAWHSAVVLPGGEGAKNGTETLERVLRAIHDAGLCRHSWVLAAGGGAVLDVAGFAASIAHRGVRLIRLPSTTLSQGDSGVGVKNGINAFGKKNFLGTFDVPWAVVNDLALLETLSDRDWRSGLSEAVKVGLLKDAALFARIERDAGRLARRDARAAEPVWRRSAELHLDHIVRGGDPFERTAARPLDFGHWSAHRLEHLSGYTVRHGEAVAIGIAADVLYSARTGLLQDAAAQRILAVLRRLGFELTHPALSREEEILEGLETFREHLGGRLTVTLLRDVGDPVDVHELEPQAVRRALRELARRTVPGRGGATAPELGAGATPAERSGTRRCG